VSEDISSEREGLLTSNVVYVNLLCKYADDTDIIIPASNSHTRTIELEHIDSWAKLSNLTLNRAKTVEVVLLTRRESVLTPTATPAWHYTMHYTKNSWSHNYQWPING